MVELMDAQIGYVDTLARSLRRWDTRLRLQHSALWLPRGLLAGLAFAVLLAVAARIWPLLMAAQVLRIGLLLGGLGVVAALLLVWAWRRTLIDLARRFDLLLGLKERTSTALELHSGAIPVESRVLARAQLEQAALAVGRVHADSSMPLRSDPRAWLGSGILAGAFALLVILPNPQDAVLAAQAELQQMIAEQVEELESLTDQVRALDTLSEDEQFRVVEVLEDAIQTLETPDLSQAEVVAALESAEQQLRDLSEQFAAERQQALRGLADTLEGEPLADTALALQAGDALGAAEALSNLDLSSLSPEEQQALAETLRQAAEAAAAQNPDLAQALEDAAQALEQGDISTAQEALDEAAQELADSQNTETVDQLAEQVGKAQRSAAAAGAPQPGQDGMGQAQPGQGQQPGSQPGTVPGSSGAGRGEGDQPAQGGVAGADMPTDNNPGDGGLQEFEQLYAPQRVGGEGGDQVDVPGSPEPGMPTGREGDFVENPTGQSSVPYNQVFADYAGTVNKALESGYVPLGMRDLIRSYFSRLDPNQ